MVRTKMVLMVMVMLLLAACNNGDRDQGKEMAYAAVIQDNQGAEMSTQQPEMRENKAQIVKFKTDLEEEHVWHFVPEGVETMTISVEAENVETILFWISPTGTETWGERELVGYDIDGSDGWSMTWDFGDRIFLDRLSIQALGMDGESQATETFNLRSRYETESGQ